MIVAFEKYASCVAEAAVLNANHWLELYGKTKYRFDHGGVVDLEANNGFVYYTLREDGELCGHVGFMIIKAPYLGQLIALDAFYYIKPEYRGTLEICKLLKFAGKHLMENKIGTVVISHKTGANLSPILTRAGYKESGTTFFFKESQ